MTDVSGIPNMGFGGGGYFGGIPNQQPAMSAAQINAGIWGNYSPQQAQATANNIYGAGGFGAQPAYYAGLGAAYGRATGGFSGEPGRVGTISNPYGGATPTPTPRPAASDPWAGTGFDPIQYLHNNPDVAGATGGDPMKAYEHARSYGVNEGRGGTDMFDPGESWSPPQERINQGFDTYPNWNPGAQSYNAQPNWGDVWRRTLPQLPPMPANTYTPPGQQQSGLSRDLIMAYAPEPIVQTDTGQLFDSIKYLQQNPDVAAAGQPGWQHYQNFGRNEGREGAWGNVFNPNTYLQNNADVAAAGVDPRTHWLQYGQKEGRQGGGIINDTRDNIARLLGSPTGPAAQATAAGLGGRPYDTWNPMTGGNASVQQLVNQGAGLNMPSGFGGSTYADNRMYGAPSSGYLGIQTPAYQDPFSGYRNPAEMMAGGGFPGNYTGARSTPYLGFTPNEIQGPQGGFNWSQQ